MKGLARIVWFVAIAMSPLASAEQRCSKIVLSPNIHVRDGLLSLADLLPSEGCPALLAAASRVPLGRAPLPGSARVLSGDGVRQLLEDVYSPTAHTEGPVEFKIPNRIALTRSDARMTCADIAGKIATAVRSRPPVSESESATSEGYSSEHLLPGSFDCGVADRVPASAVLEVIRTFLDPASSSVESLVRCINPHDCVPFLVRARVTGQQAALTVSSAVKPSFSAVPSRGPQASQLRERAAKRLSAPPLIRAGQMATLLWERDGIRIVLPVVCLERGSRGDSIQVRVKSSSRVLRAEIESAGVLRASL
jgi:hypothetical protein